MVTSPLRLLWRSPRTSTWLDAMVNFWSSSCLAAMFDPGSSHPLWNVLFSWILVLLLPLPLFLNPLCLFLITSSLLNKWGTRTQSLDNFSLLATVTPLVIPSNFMALNTVYVLMNPSSELTAEFQTHRSNCLSDIFIWIPTVGNTNRKCPSQAPNLLHKAFSWNTPPEIIKCHHLRLTSACPLI